MLGVLGRILKYLWTVVVEPILTALAYTQSTTPKRRIWWCATGPLAFMPLHAAGIYEPKGTCLSDFAVSSYVYTISNLIDRTKRNTTPTSNRLLLVSQPDSPGLPYIPATVAEVTSVSTCVMQAGEQVTMLQGKEATVRNVSEQILAHNSVHLACHAGQQAEKPLDSAFYLRDGRLELSEIIRKHNPDADLAFLSACQTSTGDEELPEEALHLAAGMLAAGFRSVVATMWSIKDAFGPDVAEQFYCRLLEEGQQKGVGIDGCHAAVALHAATQRLRQRLGDSEQGLLTWVPYVHFGI